MKANSQTHLHLLLHISHFLTLSHSRYWTLARLWVRNISIYLKTTLLTMQANTDTDHLHDNRIRIGIRLLTRMYLRNKYIYLYTLCICIYFIWSIMPLTHYKILKLGFHFSSHSVDKFTFQKNHRNLWANWKSLQLKKASLNIIESPNLEF